MRNQQGIVVTLIVFIVLTLILGFTTYFGFNEMSKKKGELDKTSAELANATNENKTLTNDFKAVKTKLKAGGFEGLDGAKIVEEMTKDIQSAMGDSGVAVSYQDALQQLGQTCAQQTQTIFDLTKQVNDETERANAEAAKTKEQKDAFDVALATKQQELDAKVKAAYSERDNITAQFTEQTKAFNNVKTEADQEIAAAKQQTADANEVASSVAEINVDLAAKIDQLSKADFSKADAEVVYADQVNRVVRLNVGEQDGVRPQTTFNVFPADALDMGSAESKGVVEVVRVVDAHVCEAKIRQDEVANPVMPGDLVYTPLWRRGDVVKYALDYKLDINGDGKSDFEELYNLIETSGAKVAAYINDSGEVVGEITPDVFRVVVSDESILDILARESSLDDATKKKIQADQAKFLTTAKENSVKRMTLADFLDRVGYVKTAQITRYKETGGMPFVQDGINQTPISNGTVAPIYQNSTEPVVPSTGVTAPIFKETSAPPVPSPGVTAPIFDKTSDPPVPSAGKVSDYYFRQRQPKKD